jgi:hypothetical protein
VVSSSSFCTSDQDLLMGRLDLLSNHSNSAGNLEHSQKELNYKLECNLIYAQLKLLAACKFLSTSYLNYLLNKIKSLGEKYTDKDEETSRLLELANSIHLLEKDISLFPKTEANVRFKKEELASFFYLFAENETSFLEFSGAFLLLESCEMQILHLGMLNLMRIIRQESDLNFDFLLDSLTNYLSFYTEFLSLNFDWPAFKKQGGIYGDFTRVEELILFIEKKFNLSFPKIEGKQTVQFFDKDSLEVVKQTEALVTTPVINVKLKEDVLLEHSLREAFSFVRSEKEVIGFFDSQNRLVDIKSFTSESGLDASHSLQNGYKSKVLVKKTVINLQPNDASELVIVVSEQSNCNTDKIIGTFSLEENDEFEYELSSIVLSPESSKENYLVCKKEDFSWVALGESQSRNSNFTESTLVYKRSLKRGQEGKGAKRVIEGVEGSLNKKSRVNADEGAVVKHTGKKRRTKGGLASSSLNRELSAPEFLLRKVQYESLVVSLNQARCSMLLPSVSNPLGNIWMKYFIPKVEEQELPSIASFLQEGVNVQKEHELELNLFSTLWHREISVHTAPYEFMTEMLSEDLLKEGSSLKLAAQVLGGAWASQSKMHKENEWVSLDGFHSGDALSYISKVLSLMLHPSIGLDEQEISNYQSVIDLFKTTIELDDYLRTSTYEEYCENKKQHVSHFGSMRRGEKELILGGSKGFDYSGGLTTPGHAMYYLVECREDDEFFISIYNRGLSSGGRFSAHLESGSKLVPSKVQVGPFTREEITDITLWTPFLDQKYLSGMVFESGKSEKSPIRLNSGADLEWLIPYVSSLGKKVTYSNWLTVQKSGNCAFKSAFAFIYDQDPKNYFLFSTLMRLVTLAVKQESILRGKYSEKNLPVTFKLGKHALQQLSKRLIKSKLHDLSTKHQSILKALHYRLSYVHYSLLQDYEAKNKVVYSLQLFDDGIDQKQVFIENVSVEKKLSSPKSTSSYIGYDSYNTWLFNQIKTPSSNVVWSDHSDGFCDFITDIEESFVDFKNCYERKSGGYESDLGLHFYASQLFIKPLPLDLFVDISSLDAYFATLTFEEIDLFHSFLSKVTDMYTGEVSSKCLEHDVVLDLWKLYYIQLCVSHYYNLFVDGKGRFVLEGREEETDVVKISCDWSLLKHLPSLFELCAPNCDYQETLDLLKRGFSQLVPSGKDNFYDLYERAGSRKDDIEQLAQNISAFDFERCYEDKEKYLIGRRKSKSHSFLKKNYPYLGRAELSEDIAFYCFSNKDSLESSLKKSLPNSYVNLGLSHYVAYKYTLNYMSRLDVNTKGVFEEFQSKKKEEWDEPLFGEFNFVTPFIRNLLERHSHGRNLKFNSSTLISYNKFGVGQLPRLVESSLRSRSYPVLITAIREQLVNDQSNDLLFELLEKSYCGESLKYFIQNSKYSFWQITKLVIEELEAVFLAPQLNKKVDVERILILSMVASKILCISKEIEGEHFVVNQLKDSLLRLLENYNILLPLIGEDFSNVVAAQISLQQTVLFFLSNVLECGIDCKLDILSSFCLYKSKDFLNRSSRKFDDLDLDLLPASGALSSKENLQCKLKQIPEGIILFFAHYFDNEYLKVIKEVEKSKTLLARYLLKACPLYTDNISESKILFLEEEEREVFSGFFGEGSGKKKTCKLYKEQSQKLDSFWSQKKYENMLTFRSKEEECGWVYDLDKKCFQLISKKTFISLSLEKLSYQSMDIELTEIGGIVSEVCNDVLGNQNLKSPYNQGNMKNHFHFREGSFVARSTCSVFVDSLSTKNQSYLIYNCLPSHKAPLEGVSHYIVVDPSRPLLSKEGEGNDYFTIKSIGKRACFTGRRYKGNDVERRGLIEFSSIYYYQEGVRHLDRPGQLLLDNAEEINNVPQLSFLKRLVTDLSLLFIWVDESEKKEIKQVDLPLETFLEKEPLSLVNLNGELTLNLFPDYVVACCQHINSLSYTKNHLVFENQNTNKKIAVVYPFLISPNRSTSTCFYDTEFTSCLDSFGEVVSSFEKDGESGCFIYKLDHFGNVCAEGFSAQIYLVYLYCINENYLKAVEELNNIQVYRELSQFSSFDKKVINYLIKINSKTSEQGIFFDQLKTKFEAFSDAFSLNKRNDPCKGMLDGAFYKVLISEESAEKEKLFSKEVFFLSNKARPEFKIDKNSTFYFVDVFKMILEVSTTGKSCFVADELCLLPFGVVDYKKYDSKKTNTDLSGMLIFFINAFLQLKDANTILSKDQFQIVKRYILSSEALYTSSSEEKRNTYFSLRVLKLMVMCLDRKVAINIPELRSSSGINLDVDLFFPKLDRFIEEARWSLMKTFPSFNQEKLAAKDSSLVKYISRRARLREDNFSLNPHQKEMLLPDSLDIVNEVIFPKDLINRLNFEKENVFQKRGTLERFLVEVVKAKDEFCERLIRARLGSKVKYHQDTMFLYLSQRVGYLSLIKDLTRDYLKFGGKEIFKGLDLADVNICKKLLINYNVCWWYESHLKAMIKFNQENNEVEFDVEKSKSLSADKARFLKENLLGKRSTVSQIEFVKGMFSLDKVIGLLSMGAGKTTFLIPMMVHELLFIRKQGVMVVLPNASVYPILSHELWKMGISCVRFKFSRQNCTRKRLEELITVYEHAREYNEVVIVSERTLQSMLSMYSERLELARSINNDFIEVLKNKYLESGSREEFKDFLKRVDPKHFITDFSLTIDRKFVERDMKKCFESIFKDRDDLQSLFSTFTSYIKRFKSVSVEVFLAGKLEKLATSFSVFVDEVDMHGVKKSHNFPVGKEAKFSHIYFDCIADLYFKILPESKFFTVLQENKQTGLSQEIVESCLLPELSEEVLKLLEKTTDSHLVNELGRDNIICYLQGSSNSSTLEDQSKVHQKLCQWLEEDSSIEKMLFASILKVYRELLVTYFPVALKNSVFSDYAPSYERTESLICIPQVANGRGKEGSQFRDFMHTSMLTCQFYLQDFTRESTFLSFLKFLSEEKLEREDADFITDFFEASSLEQLIDTSWRQSKSEDVKQRIQDEIRSCNKQLLHLIGLFFKKEALSKELKSSNRKVFTYLRELISSFKVFKGASGTSSEVFNLPCPVIDIDATYQKTTEACCAQGRVFVKEFETPVEFIEVIKEVCTETGTSLGLVRAIIDVSPLFKGMNPQQVVPLLKEHLSEVKSCFISYGESKGEEFITSTKKDSNNSIAVRCDIRDYMEVASKSKEKYDDIVVFHDHLHVRAGNIWLPDGSIGVVTFDNTVSYHDLLQGACRMRQLVSRGHKMWIFITPVLLREINSFLVKEEGSTVVVADIIEFAKLKTEEKEKGLYLQGKLLEIESVLKMESLKFLKSLPLNHSLAYYSKIFYSWITKSSELSDIKKMGMVHQQQRSLAVIHNKIVFLKREVERAYNFLKEGSSKKRFLTFAKIVVPSLDEVLKKIPPLPELTTNTNSVEGESELQVELQDHLQFNDEFSDFSNYELLQPSYYLNNLFLLSSSELISQLTTGRFQQERVVSLPGWLSTNFETNPFLSIFSEGIYATKSQAIIFEEQGLRSTMLTSQEKPICYYLVLQANTQFPKILIVSLEQYSLLEKHYIEALKNEELPEGHLDGSWIVQSDGHVVLGKESDIAWDKNCLFDLDTLSPQLTMMLVEVLVMSRNWSRLISPKIKPLLQEWLKTKYKLKKQLINFLLKNHPIEAVSRSGLEIKRFFDS